MATSKRSREYCARRGASIPDVDALQCAVDPAKIWSQYDRASLDGRIEGVFVNGQQQATSECLSLTDSTSFHFRGERWI
jgi:hypothetical protein